MRFQDTLPLLAASAALAAPLGPGRGGPGPSSSNLETGADVLYLIGDILGVAADARGSHHRDVEKRHEGPGHHGSGPNAEDLETGAEILDLIAGTLDSASELRQPQHGEIEKRRPGPGRFGPGHGPDPEDLEAASEILYLIGDTLGSAAEIRHEHGGNSNNGIEKRQRGPHRFGPGNGPNAEDLETASDVLFLIGDALGDAAALRHLPRAEAVTNRISPNKLETGADILYLIGGILDIAAEHKRQ